MEIEYKGANFLTLKIGTTMVIIDPLLPGVSQKKIKSENTIQLSTEEKFSQEDEGMKLFINGPGEYEVSGVSVIGISTQLYNPKSEETTGTIYKLDIGGYRVGVLGHIKPGLEEAQLENLGTVDILTLPVGGGGYTLDAHEAASVVRQINPKIVIPTHYNDPSIQYDMPQTEVDGFLKELGVGNHDKVDKLKLKAGSSLPDILTVLEISRT